MDDMKHSVSAASTFGSSRYKKSHLPSNYCRIQYKIQITDAESKLNTV